LFADLIVAAVKAKGSPVVVGLDPRLELMPDFVTRSVRTSDDPRTIGRAIAAFNARVIELIAPSVPAVKLQIAFYEQYGLTGLEAFAETIAAARDAGLIVIVDAKRNDIDSTARAYANAFLGGGRVFGRRMPAFDVDCITVSPFLGADSLGPFVEACSEQGTGIFVLVKTSNPGSKDIQDRQLGGGETISSYLAGLVDRLGSDIVGTSGYSSIGAVVGATFPDEAQTLRRLMPRAIILVPGYGAQGGTAADAVASFNDDGLGAVVNASRSITYDFGDASVAEADFNERIRGNVESMVTDLRSALGVLRPHNA
jgi:orotidine-5'-phosphate decarboxylase